MKVVYKYFAIPLLTLMILFSGNGITICKMACLESGVIQVSLNEVETCCEEEESDPCCETKNSCEDEESGCCNHSDQTIQLDNFLDTHTKQINTPVVFVCVSPLFKLQFAKTPLTEVLAFEQNDPPPRLTVSSFNTFTHTYLI